MNMISEPGIRLRVRVVRFFIMIFGLFTVILGLYGIYVLIQKL